MKLILDAVMLVFWSFLIGLGIGASVSSIRSRLGNVGVLAGDTTPRSRAVDWTKYRWLRPAIVAFILGLGVWAVPKLDQLHAGLGTYSDANRFSELGAAMAGGALVAGVVLFIEGRQQEQRENRSLRFQVSITSNVSGIDLRGHDLTGSYWRGKNVSLAALDKTNLDSSLLLGCNFRGSLLWGISFRGTELVEALFGGSKLGGAKFVEADLTGASLIGADLSGRRNPYNDDPSYAGGANLKGAKLMEADLSAAWLNGVNFMEADLSAANLKTAIGLSEALNVKHAKRNALTEWPQGYVVPVYEEPARGSQRA